MSRTQTRGPLKVISGKLNPEKAMLVFRLTATEWGVPETELAWLLGLSQNDWQRMKDSKRFPSMDHEATDRSTAFVMTFFHVARIFGPKTPEHLNWVMAPNGGKPFNGKTPLEYFKKTGVGGMFLVYDLVATTPPKSQCH
jgi:hypothetical protein